MDLETVALLTSAKGWSLIAALPEYDEESAVALGTSLREAGYAPELVAAALTQSRLRARAVAKFGEFARGMLLTPDGLEQATRLEIAARHASRYRNAGIGHVYDLGCGIGSDAMAFASLGMAVTAVDADAATATIAGVNLRHFPDVTTSVALAEEFPLPSTAETSAGTGVWFDPARRVVTSTDASGRARRVTGLEAISPPWSFVQSVAERVSATGAKLAPNFPRSAVPAGAEAQWTSLRGEVLECAVWWGPLVENPGRTAVILGGPSPLLVTEADAGELGPVASALPQSGAYLYEPDRAVIAAGLTGALVAAVDGTELGTGVGYVVSQTPVDVPWATRYVVTHAMKANAKQVRQWLRAQGAGRLTLKRRGGRIDPDTFRQQLRLDGKGDEITAILITAGTTPAFLAVERV
ncbi:MAG: class I SAM-dependent methyltransferase [Dermatophilus congolensis]|nr:class I SAM-dependent methyltransferase [Dermatophilus congolensis]